jgi:REP element-mobilizing transposase RayT
VKPTRTMSLPGTYFVTFITWQRRRLFVVEPYARLFLKTLYSYKRQGRFQLHAFVLMREHVHLLLTPANDLTLESAIQLIKGGYSHTFGFCEASGVYPSESGEAAVGRVLWNSRYCCAYPGFKRTSEPQRLKPLSPGALSARLKSCPSPSPFGLRVSSEELETRNCLSLPARLLHSGFDSFQVQIAD